jgi:hypothetical protein
MSRRYEGYRDGVAARFMCGCTGERVDQGGASPHEDPPRHPFCQLRRMTCDTLRAEAFTCAHAHRAELLDPPQLNAIR